VTKNLAGLAYIAWAKSFLCSSDVLEATLSLGWLEERWKHACFDELTFVGAVVDGSKILVVSLRHNNAD